MIRWHPRVSRTAVWGVGSLLLIAQGCASLPGLGWTRGDLPAFAQVDEGLYRGGQPSPEGIRRLAQMGVKTIVNLRHHSKAMDQERRLAQELGMRWVNLPMYVWWRPSDAQVRQFLSIVTDPVNRPVFAHCRQGWNRVGIMVAIYRVVANHWTPYEAYLEGRRHGLAAWNLATRHLLFRETPSEFLLGRDPPS